MAFYGITAVRLNAKGRIEKVRWRRIDGAANNETVVEAHEVANALACGDTVTTIHGMPGGTVPGANAKYVVFEQGNEGIETLNPDSHPGRTLLDLPRF